MIRLAGIRKSFNQGKPNEFNALNDLNLSLSLHEISVLKGPSGSGKTTLLSIIGCMVRPTAGRVFLAEREITSLPERFLSRIRRETFGFIFQQFNLIRGLTTLENVMAPAYPTGEKYSSLRERALELLATFDLSRKATTNVDRLSGGEAQRVAVVRALINNPAIIIADEPTAHLDSRLSREFMACMGALSASGKTIIMASHDPIVFRSEMVTTVIEMRDGEIVPPADAP